MKKIIAMGIFMKKSARSFCLCLVVFMSLCFLLCGCGSKETDDSSNQTDPAWGGSNKDDSSEPKVDRIELTSKNIFDYIDYSFTYELIVDKGSDSSPMWVYNVKITTRSVSSDYEFYNATITFFDGVHIPGREYKRVVHMDKTGYGYYNAMETYYGGTIYNFITPTNRSDVQVEEGGYVLIPRSL